MPDLEPGAVGPGNRPATGRTAAFAALAVLFAINALNFFDRSILGAVGEPIRKEWGIGDTAMGTLGTAFTLLYACVGVPLGRLADGAVRTRLLAAGVFVWSLLTAASGLARNFVDLFLIRLGVGVGEATCAPASTSMIGDLFAARHRARALSVFMMGLPVGIALSFAVSSLVAKSHGWRAAFFIAGLPGILCAVAALAVREPPRGTTEAHPVGARRRPGSPYLLVLSIPTVGWLIISGALHNFNMYALGQFLQPLLMRRFHQDIGAAGLVSMAVYGLSGIPGLLVGGIAGDAASRRRKDGRLLVGTGMIGLATPLVYLALTRPAADLTGFALLMGLGLGLMYAYYSTVYSTLQDVIEPSLRGTGMALYFFAMYVVGASLGPLATGAASDFFARRAAVAAGVVTGGPATLEPFRASGIHSALFLLPVLSGLLALVLFAASRTVTRDAARYETWMRDTAS